MVHIDIILIIRHFQFYFFTPFLISTSGGKVLLPPLGEGRDGGNKNNYITLGLFMITDGHIKTTSFQLSGIA